MFWSFMKTPIAWSLGLAALARGADGECTVSRRVLARTPVAADSKRIPDCACKWELRCKCFCR
jgi:hypothetical protein